MQKTLVTKIIYIKFYPKLCVKLPFFGSMTSQKCIFYNSYQTLSPYSLINNISKISKLKFFTISVIHGPNNKEEIVDQSISQDLNFQTIFAKSEKYLFPLHKYVLLIHAGFDHTYSFQNILILQT